MAARGLTDVCRVEAGALDEYVGCCLRHAAVHSAEDTGDTHRFTPAVADAEVTLVEFALDSVECGERCACRALRYDDFFSFDFVEVEAMERLAEGMEDIIRYVDDVVDRAQADS